MRSKLRVLIVDDEPAVRDDIRAHVERNQDCEVVGEAGNGRDALLAIDELHPDIIFLDVQMPELDGFAVAAEVGPDPPPVIVFVTAYDQYALRAFEAHAVDYLLKPFDTDRFLRALAKAQRATGRLTTSTSEPSPLDTLLAEIRETRAAPERFVVKKGQRILLIPMTEVEYIEAAGNYAYLHHKDGQHLIRETFNALEERLELHGFVRVHRSSIIRLDAVVELEPLGSGDHIIRMRSGREVNLSRTYRKSLERWLGDG